MKFPVLRFFLLLTVISLGLASCSTKEQHPDIILFLVDDMGWTDTSVPFAHEPTENNLYQHTPNMLRLAMKE